MTNQLQNYFYLQSRQQGVLGWVGSTDHGMEILNTHYTLTPLHASASLLTMKLAFKYQQHPHPDGDTSTIVPLRDDKLLVLKGIPENTDTILATLSPMLYKGLSARLATIHLPDDDIYLVRVSEDSAMPQDPYIALLQQDVQSYWYGGTPIRRQNTSRKDNQPAQTTHLVLRSGSEYVPLYSITPHAMDIALAALGLSRLTPTNRLLVDFLRTLTEVIEPGRLRIYGTSLWQHHRTGGIQIGDYPTTYGHPGSYIRVGTICSDMISNRPGRLAQLTIDGISVVIDREPGQI